MHSIGVRVNPLTSSLAMLVYITYQKRIRRVVDVTLLHGYMPKCRHVTENRIDPALWYKVLVLDSILVDCDRKNVFWKRGGLQEKDYIHTCHESELNIQTAWPFFKDEGRVFEDDECYDFDPAYEELFEIAVTIFQKLSWESVDKDGNSDAYENVLKMLHVFLLPRIKFNINDRIEVNNVLKEIEKHHQNVEDQVREKYETIKSAEDELHEKRIQLLQDGRFSSAPYLAKCDPDFLNVFLIDLKKFIWKCNEALDQFDKKIAPIRHSQIKETMVHLKGLRFERDALYETIEKAVLAREEIKNVVTRRHTKTPNASNDANSSCPLIGAYVKVSENIDAIKDKMQDFIKEKIKISSVREAVLLTLNEIDRDTYSYGYNSRRDSFLTDVDMLQSVSKPEKWKTVTEKVAQCLQMNQTGFRFEHEKFCERIKLQCQQLCDESQLFSFPAINTELSKMTQRVSPNTDPSVSDMPLDFLTYQNAELRLSITTVTNTQTSRCSIEIVSKDKCRRICEDIVNHIQDMAHDLTKELFTENTEPHTCLINKVYVCYEEHVSSKLMPVLTHLYQKSYAESCPGLSAWLCNVRLSDIRCGKMKLLNIIKPPTASMMRSSRESSEESEKSVEEFVVEIRAEEPETHEDRNVHEMYNVCNQWGDTMPRSFTPAFELNTHLPGEANSTPGDSGGAPRGCEEQSSCMIESCGDATRSKALGSFHGGHAVSGGSRNSEPSKPRHTCSSVALGAGGQPSPSQCDTECRKGIINSPTHYTSHLHYASKEFETFIRDEEKENTLFRKLHKTTGMVRYVDKTFTRLRKDSGVEMAVSADDLVNAVTALLCKVDSQLVLQFYAHVSLMNHLRPEFLLGTVHDYSLVTLVVAFQHLFQQSQITGAREY